MLHKYQYVSDAFDGLTQKVNAPVVADNQTVWQVKGEVTQ